MDKTAPQETLPEVIGPYKVLKCIGRGGMGEVFLAFDPACERNVAIKRIRPDLLKQKLIRDRFLKEAKITASLCHPSIIPVFSIHQSEEELYYVMPYIEGKTLRVILHESIKREDSPSPPTISISSALRMFQNICQAVSYCHSKGILHRDLKPENVMIANFGQVIIFDWGLAGFTGEKEPNLPEVQEKDPSLTKPGKVMGTLSYMPPERFDGSPADVSTDIYSLGVILYQLLTLRMPFHRTTIESYRKVRKHERLLDVLEAAPYRDIPPQLSEITKKCLATSTKDRYHNVSDLINDLSRFNAGLPDWVFAAELDVNKSQDWEFQENVLLSKLIAITRSTEIMHWYFLMISKASFSGNKRIVAKLELKKESEGIGFLFNIPEPKERDGLESGYIISLGSKKNPGIRLCRSYVSLIEIPDGYLEEEKTHYIEIEKMDQKIQLFIDGRLVLDYTDPLPIVGTHVGLICQDMEFTLHSHKIFVGSQNAMVGCLSIPDAFFACKSFDKAFAEYERIADCFSGRSEGREALFRSGITLLEMTKLKKNTPLKESLFEKALEQFEKLHQSPSEPLEYLGKSLVYQKKGDLEEELKCLELAIRKFKNHSQTHLIEERIIFRLHECAKSDRIGVYNFALITLKHLQHRLSDRETHALIHNLSNNSEKLYFNPCPKKFPDLSTKYRFMAIELAFWLDKPLILKEMQEEEPHLFLKDNIPFLIDSLTLQNASKLPENAKTPDNASIEDLRPFLFYIDQKLTPEEAESLTPLFDHLTQLKLSPEAKKALDILHIWQLLLIKNLPGAKKLLDTYAREAYEKCSSPFFMLMGVYLAATSGLKHAMTHFTKCIDYAFPPIYSLLAHYLKGGNTFLLKWHDRAFTWEKICFQKQTTLFYHCLGKKTKAQAIQRTLGRKRYFSIL